jgi:hypothetical protein
MGASRTESRVIAATLARAKAAREGLAIASTYSGGQCRSTGRRDAKLSGALGIDPLFYPALPDQVRDRRLAGGIKIAPNNPVSVLHQLKC